MNCEAEKKKKSERHTVTADKLQKSQKRYELCGEGCCRLGEIY